MAQRSSPALVNQWFANPSKDLLSGLVVAFAMIPEAIAFSGIAGVDPKVGLFEPSVRHSPSPWWVAAQR